MKRNRNPSRTVALCVGGAVCVVYVAAFMASSWLFEGGQDPSMFTLCVQLVGTTIFTFVIWRLIPQFRRGYCQQCGYDLTGNVSGKCPECGQPFEPQGDAP